ncbi:MAG: DegT/DnrJ/EryC1/StrS family aminotransferase [Microthrixaceae bacterium]
MGRPDRIQVNATALTSQDRDAVDGVLRSGWIGTGPECAAFEADLAAFLGAEHVICVSSCTAGLELLFDQLEIGPGDRVAVPAWTYAATALPAVHRGADLVLVDSDPDTLAIAPESLERAMSDADVDLVIPVHLAGVPVPRTIWDLSAAHGAAVVEDAAHAFGARDEHGLLRGVGSVGAAFSFHATKNLTCGEGGAIVTSDDQLAEALRRARLHGLDRDAWEREVSGSWRMGDVVEPGRKANLPDLLAALGRSQLRTFSERQAIRRALVERYRQQLDGIDGLRLVPSEPHPGSADHLVMIVLPRDADRETVVGELAARGISTGLHYTPLHRLRWFAQHATLAPGGLPVCDDMADRVMTLPLHASLSLDDVDEVCATLEKCLGHA